MERVFVNLVQNAIEFGPPRQTIRIATEERAAEAPGLIHVTVEDEGPGIGDEEADRIFEPFVSGSAVKVAPVRGLGLGLAVCRWVVEAHGGAIDLNSASGIGARFRVCLPLAEQGENDDEPG